MFELSFQFELTRFFLKELYKYLPNSYNLLTRGCAWGVSLVPVISISNYFQFLHNKNKFKKYTKNYQIILKKTRAKYWKSSLEKIPSNIHDNNNLIIRKKKKYFQLKINESKLIVFNKRESSLKSNFQLMTKQMYVKMNSRDNDRFSINILIPFYQ